MDRFVTDPGKKLPVIRKSGTDQISADIQNHLILGILYSILSARAHQPVRPIVFYRLIDIRKTLLDIFVFCQLNAVAVQERNRLFSIEHRQQLVCFYGPDKFIIGVFP